MRPNDLRAFSRRGAMRCTPRPRTRSYPAPGSMARLPCAPRAGRGCQSGPYTVVPKSSNSNLKCERSRFTRRPADVIFHTPEPRRNAICLPSGENEGSEPVASHWRPDPSARIEAIRAPTVKTIRLPSGDQSGLRPRWLICRCWVPSGRITRMPRLASPDGVEGVNAMSPRTDQAGSVPSMSRRSPLK
jgi:hypothetical protein